MARGKKRGVAKRGKAKKSKVTAKKIAKQAKPVEFYYWPTPNGFKISIMLEECGLPYVLKPVNISKGEQFNPDFLKIAPNNRMPAIVDPQGPGGLPFPSLSPVQFCSISAARPESSIRRTNVHVSKLISGCFGKWADSARWPANSITSSITRARHLVTQSNAMTTRSTGFTA